MSRDSDDEHAIYNEWSNSVDSQFLGDDPLFRDGYHDAKAGIDPDIYEAMDKDDVAIYCAGWCQGHSELTGCSLKDARYDYECRTGVAIPDTWSDAIV